MYMVPVIGPGEARRRKRRELSEEQKQEIVEAFNFDTDKDQAMDYHELKTEAFFTDRVRYYYYYTVVSPLHNFL